MNYLLGFAAIRHEGSSQALMAVDDFLEALLQNACIQRPLNAHGKSYVVSGQARFEPVNQPEPLLGKRGRVREGLPDGRRLRTIVVEVVR